MEEGKKPDNHLTSAAAFVEGGIQDACSICLEEFCENDPSTVTNCKHEFHLQCVLEWCQRSFKCPMCWQHISLKDAGSQELLDVVENERNIRTNPPSDSTTFHHPTLREFEFQHFPGGASEAELEEHIIQHLAAAASIRRARHTSRRGEGQRRGWETSGHGRSHVLVFSSHLNAPSAAADVADFHTPEGGSDGSVVSASTPTNHTNQHESLNNRLPVPSNPDNQDRARPSDFHSFSEALKSRISSVSMRYKDSIIKSTRGWRERLLSRNNPPQDPSADEMERVEARDSVSSNLESCETAETANNHHLLIQPNAPRSPFGTNSAAN